MGLIDALGPLISGATQGVGAYAQGKVQADDRARQRRMEDQQAHTAAEDREREIRMEALRRQLLNAQIGQANARTAQMQTPAAPDPVELETLETASGIFNRNPVTGELTPAMTPGGQQAQPRPRGTPSPPAPLRFTGPDGRERVLDRTTGVARLVTDPAGTPLPAPTEGPGGSGDASEFETRLRQMERLASLADNPQAQTAFLFSFMKLIDDGGVVREGDIRMLAATQSLKQRLENAAKRTQTGQVLTQDQMQGYLEAARALAGDGTSPGGGATGGNQLSTGTNEGATAPDGQSNAVAKDRGAEGGGTPATSGPSAGGWQARARELRAQGKSHDEIVATLRAEGLIR